MPKKYSAIACIGDGLKNGRYKFYAGFKNIDNYVNDQGELVAVSNDRSYLNANTIIINRFSSGQISNVEICDNQILLNSVSVSTKNAQIYQSSIDYSIYTLNDAVKKINTFIYQYRHYVPSNSILGLLLGTIQPGLQMMPCKNNAYENELWLGFEQAFSIFENDFFRSIGLFKGRGVGLTPSGDDFIAGVLYGMHFLEVSDGLDYADMKHEVFNISKSSNLFSNNMLNMALKAQYFKRLKDFLHALLHASHPETKTSFCQLMSTGHTSGTDLLAGFFSVILHKNRQAVFNRYRNEKQLPRV